MPNVLIEFDDETLKKLDILKAIDGASSRAMQVCDVVAKEYVARGLDKVLSVEVLPRNDGQPGVPVVTINPQIKRSTK